MRGKVWLSVDTDDYDLLPSIQGHSTRSPDKIIDMGNYQASDDLISGFKAMSKWMESNDHPITIFVIAGQLNCSKFKQSLRSLIVRFPDRITLGNHGYNHRSWSSFGPDLEGFSRMLEKSESIMLDFDEGRFRKWFRAPSGYIDEWMIKPLVEAGYSVDSSVNPSLLMNYKYGKSNYKSLLQTIADSGMKERKWKTRLGLPVCGPALFKFPLRWNAKRGWNRCGEILSKEDVDEIVEGSNEIETIYWHILDFSRKSSTWIPPLKYIGD